MSDETRERILNAAGEVFASKGFEKATVREICQLAGANIAAVNYHFGDKQKLYIEAVKQAHCESTPEPIQDWPGHLPAEQQLYLFVEQMMIDMLERETPGWHLELMMREMARPTSACEEVVSSYIGPKFSLLMEIVKQLLPEQTPQAECHLFGFSVVGQCLLYRFHRPIGRLLVGDQEFEALFDVQRLSEQITRFSLGGLKNRTPVERPLIPTEEVRP